MKRNILIMFGGNSSEHDISIKSYFNIIKHINKDKYNIKSIYIDLSNNWYLLKNNKKLESKELLNNKIINNIDVVFPIIHGSYGEDGKLQGYLEMLNIPYVGCNMLASSICMDKVFCKELIKNIDVLQTNYIYLYKDYDIVNILKEIKKNIGYPCFIKPSNGGSSIGINKVNNESEVDKYIKEALKYDNKVIIEKEIKGREIEIGVIGNDEFIVSSIGEVKTNNFYSYENKYVNNSSTVTIPANINNNLKKEIENSAKKIYKYLECSGMARIDFFIEEKTNNIYLNEINTIPGFTDISMFPLLFKNIGLKYDVLIDKLIDLSLIKGECI